MTRGRPRTEGVPRAPSGHISRAKAAASCHTGSAKARQAKVKDIEERLKRARQALDRLRAATDSAAGNIDFMTRSVAQLAAELEQAQGKAQGR